MPTTELKIAYIGGGSREWARKLMFDLALCPEFSGQVALYDIDIEAARLNEQLGNWLQDQPGVVSRFAYEAVSSLETALKGAANRDPEAHREAVREALAARGPEARKERARKAAETRRRNREAAKGEP